MKNRNVHILIGIALLTIVPFFQNCAGSMDADGNLTSKSADVSDEEIEVALPALKAEIERSVSLECSQASECDSIAAGARACGGPSHYYVYSKVSTDVERIQKLAQKLTELETKRNLRDNLVGTCLFIEPPQLDCVHNRCKSVPPSQTRQPD